MEEGGSAKSGPGSQIGAVCRCDREEKANHSHTTLSKAPFGFHIDVTTSLEELGSTNLYRRSKHAWKVAKVPNLAQAAKLELFVHVTGRKRPTIPTLHCQRLHLGSI